MNNQVNRNLLIVFVDVDFPDGRKHARLVTDDGDTVTVAFDDKVISDVPKSIIHYWK